MRTVLFGLALSLSLRADASPRTTTAQRLVDELVGAHPELAGAELALLVGADCRTVAATAREEVGGKCDGGELGPIRTGRPGVEPPSRKDPVYDITQALHDPRGVVIGALGMDLKPEPGATRESTLAHARSLLRELESRVVSRDDLLAQVP
ncbi:MAG TPA: PDC sensor domain-containing protein [Candidatus Polarisedimenticolaceae bacterium]|nr:PDC sensor domain-containing protein [Candidatus Polarisedimenticolaceae bacterium]